MTTSSSTSRRPTRRSPTAAVAALPKPGASPSGRASAKPSSPPRRDRGALAELTSRCRGPAETYTHGHHESVLRSHRWRTAANSAAYLLPHLQPGRTCSTSAAGRAPSPSTWRDRLAPGRVVGVDRGRAPLVTARADAGQRARRTSGSRSATSTRSRSRTTRSTSSTPTRCSSTWPIPSPRCARCAALSARRHRRRAGQRLRGDDLVPGRSAARPLAGALPRGRPRQRRRAGRRSPAAGVGAGPPGSRTSSATGIGVVLRDAGRRPGGAGCGPTASPPRPSRAGGRARPQRSRELLDRGAWRTWAAAPDGWFSVLHGEILCRC